MSLTDGKLKLFSLLVALIAMLAVFQQEAVANGALGPTGKTLGATGAGCTAASGCHFNQTATVTISGASTLNPGQSSVYTVTATNVTQTSTLSMGMDVATKETTGSNGNGTLSITPSANLYAPSTTELVHCTLASSPFACVGPLNKTDALGKASYTFTFTMPAGAVAGDKHTLYATARLGTGSSGGSWNHATSLVVTATAPPFGFVSASSRKTHNGTPFDIAIDPAGSMTTGQPITVEPRQILAGHKIVFLFDGPVTSADAATSSGSAAVAVAGNEATVTLTGVTDGTRVQVDLSNVNGLGVGATARVGFLVGDVNSSRGVSGSDVSIVKSKSGQLTDGTNFKMDLNASGGVSGSDISIVKSRSGQSLN